MDQLEGVHDLSQGLGNLQPDHFSFSYLTWEHCITKFFILIMRGSEEGHCGLGKAGRGGDNGALLGSEIILNMFVFPSGQDE